MNAFSFWCYSDNLAWVVQYAMTFGRHIVWSIERERSNIADYHLELRFENGEQVKEFSRLARNFHKIITKE